MSTLGNVGLAARFGGTLLLAVAMGKLLYVAVTAGWSDDQKPEQQQSLTEPSKGFPVRSARPGASVVASSGKPIRTKLLVSVGAERSSVRVDGATLGQTPLVTEYSCREGDTVAIEVVQPNGGNTLRYERFCVAGTIRVER